MPIVTLATGDVLTVGANASGGKVVRLFLVSQPPGNYVATQPANLVDVALEAAGLMCAAGVVIKATVTQAPNDIVDIAVEKTKQ